MKLAVIGTGYVGLVTGTCFSSMGNNVWCVDVDKKKIDSLKAGVIPIYEPGLGEMVQNSVAAGTLRFTMDISEALEDSQICFIAVGTPMREDGAADLRFVLEAAENIGRYMRRDIIVVDKSTVPVGTSERVREAVQRQLDIRGVSLQFDVVSNPEFLKEGSAIADCMKPDRVVIGAEREQTIQIMRELYKPFFMNNDNLLIMDTASAEMTKYAANAMLATKISFMNEIANICERLGANVNAVRRGIGSDRRIGYAFIYPGCGYGGSCFPKDVQALIQTAESNGIHPNLLISVEERNRMQRAILAEKVVERFGKDLNGRTFAVWGLSFKPDTDDMRESPALTIIGRLTELGAQIRAYDPKAVDAARNFYLRDYTNVTYCDSKYDALKGADALLLITDWKEFRSPDFGEIQKLLKTPVIFDGRNQYDMKQVNGFGLDYYQVGVRPALTEE